MSDKKGLSAFINKNKKTKKPKANEEQAAAALDQKAEAAQAQKAQEEAKKNTPVANDSSDEEVDELDVATKQIDYANIKENKDVSGANQGDEKKQGFGFNDESAPERAEVKKAAGKKFGEGGLSFGGGKPKFMSRKPGKFGKGDFDAGLDDLDEEGSGKKESKDNRRQEGQRDFVNLGSTAKGGATEEREERKEREPAVKPQFRGKLNLKGTGGGDTANEEGVIKSYDFRTNAYKQPNPEGGEPRGERAERKEGEEPRGERQERGGFGVRGGRGGRKDRGTAFGAKNNEEEEDDDFQVVKKPIRGTKKFNNDDDSSDENNAKEAFRGFRSGARGGAERGERGRGGFDRAERGDRGRGGFDRAERGERGRGGFFRRGGDNEESTRDGVRIERRGGNRGARGGETTN